MRLRVRRPFPCRQILPQCCILKTGWQSAKSHGEPESKPTMNRISERRGARRSTAPRQAAWRRLANPYTPMRVLSDDQLEAIHETSLEILETLGLETLDDVGLDRLAGERQRVDRASRKVCFDRHWVM